MRMIRVLVGLVMLALAFAGAAASGTALGFLLRQYSPPADIRPEVLELIGWMGWPQLTLLFVVTALYFIVAIKLFRRVKSHLWWAAAFVAHLVLWGWATFAGVLAPALPDGWPPVDLIVVGVNVASGVLILALARTHLD